MLGCSGGKQVHRSGNDASPSGLMAGSKPCAIVPVEVLVKQDVIAPVWVFLKLTRSSVHWPLALLIPQENAGQPSRKLLSDLV